MKVEAVAFVPAAPLLVPQVAGGSAGLDEDLRAACLGAIAAAVSVLPDEVVVVASVGIDGEWPAHATWDFAGFGVPRVPAPQLMLPWPLAIGAWLLDECGWNGPRRYLSAEAAAPTLGERTVTVLAVGDGSACRTERAPGHLDDRAEPFDVAIADLLASGEATGFTGIDERLAEELMCAGLPVWRWVAAAIAGSEVTKAELLSSVAPYGVGYFVAQWSVSRMTGTG